jgi:hypothetical protein
LGKFFGRSIERCEVSRLTAKESRSSLGEIIGNISLLVARNNSRIPLSFTAPKIEKLRDNERL